MRIFWLLAVAREEIQSIFWVVDIKIDAIDGSEQLCRIASKYTGIKVRQMLFQELDEKEKYEWHMGLCIYSPFAEKTTCVKFWKICMQHWNRKDGFIPLSNTENLKANETEDILPILRQITFKDFIHDMHGLKIEEQWITGDVRPGRGEEKWLNLLLQKK